MYSLKINLIGCDNTVVPPAARKILQRWAVIDVDYPTIAAFQKNVFMKDGETRLLIIYIREVDDIDKLKRVSLNFPRYPILAVFDSTSDATLVVKIMRAGALQVVHPPVLPDDLKEALDCIAAKHEGLTKLAKLVTVTGSIGGCGGTTVATNLTYELARRVKERCILMELSLRKGVLANHLDIVPRYSTTDLIADINRIDSYILQAALSEVAENFCVLAGPYDTIQTEKPNLENTMRLVELTRHLAAWVVLDVPSTYDDLFFRTLMTSDHIVLVTDQTVTGIRGVQMVCSALGQHRPIILINRYNSGSGLNLDRIKEFLPGQEVCILSNDPAVVAAMNNGKPLRLQKPRSPVLTDINSILDKLDVGERAQTVATTNNSIFGRLSRALSLS